MSGQQGFRAGEKGVRVKEPGGRINVAMIWPGSYQAGMSALGFLAIYGWLNDRPDTLAERFFLEPGECRSLESGRSLDSFHLVAGSLSLENDYWMFPEILRRGGLNPERKNRASGPVVITGGVGVWSNPWPLWSFVDLFLIGEGEEQWPRLLDLYRDRDLAGRKKEDQLEILATVPGALVPEMWQKGSEPIKPARLAWPATGLPPVSTVLTSDTEFSDTRLVEISRGCPYGCRFCLAGFLYRPHRAWSLESIMAALGPVTAGEKVGLISPAVADYPELWKLLDLLEEQGRVVGLSSLRLTAVTEDLARRLSEGKLRGVAVAPEGGSPSLRARINKNISEEEILSGSRLLALAGLRRLKLYFMIGLPGETDDDLLALVQLVERIKKVTRVKRGGGPHLTVSVANFTPKPHTPLEDEPLLTEAEFRRRGQFLKRKLTGLGSLRLDPPQWTIVQGLLARSGEESEVLVRAMMETGGRSRSALKMAGYRLDHLIHQKGPYNHRPWRIIDPAAGTDILEKEKILGEDGVESERCPSGNNCGRCKAC